MPQPRDPILTTAQANALHVLANAARVHGTTSTRIGAHGGSVNTSAATGLSRLGLAEFDHNRGRWLVTAAGRRTYMAMREHGWEPPANLEVSAADPTDASTAGESDGTP